MKTNSIIQFVLMIAIMGMAYLVVNASQNMEIPTPEALQALAARDDATTTVITLPQAVAPEDLFPQMEASTIFKEIIKAITPPPPPERKTPTPKPPPEITKVIGTEGWRLVAPLKGQAMIERVRKRDTITMKIGEKQTITYGRDQCDIELVDIDNKNFKITLKFGDQTTVLSMF